MRAPKKLFLAFPQMSMVSLFINTFHNNNVLSFFFRFGLDGARASF